ncbi:polysaccharide biosynthesis protein [Thermus tengchongensis]|uniref:Polysaccharide biosynthesis protein n=1 Tax=Thermus tengchongensis TaxID=1214928 RepID=A0A4Y9FAS9_9DEIN|nr:nucleoside-diphosphate sugar epimerase/dehydratase [Thermus tengchongensis]TFU25710.1 polysaccharide biosynthesis protein [Thermus tengchongensis]
MRGAIKFFLDLLLWTLAAPLAMALRLEGIPHSYWEATWIYTLLGIPIKALIIALFGLHRQAWSRVGVRDLVRLGLAVALAGVILFGMAWTLSAYLPMPRSVPLIATGLAFLLLGGVRLGVRLYWEEKKGRGVRGTRVLVVGAGDAGSMVVREMLRHPEAGLLPVGFVDDDPNKRGQTIAGVRVVGTLDDLPRVVRALEVEEVLVAMPSAPGSVVRKVVNLARAAGVRYRILPGIYEILSGRVSISQIREVRLEDLLRREPVRLNLDEIAGYLEGRVVLVTGAGGSIGSELVRQVARFRPEQVVLLGRGENSLFLLEKELEATWPDLKHVVVVADVRDRERLRRIFRLYRPQVVFHAAAHKHVPLMEANPDEAIFNNVRGTQNVVELCLESGVERLVNISTDKAVNPTSVMGASKRVAEQVVAWGALRAAPNQVFVSVRFGNVLGSRGSVVPVFMEQIKRGGPVTVTHPEMRRYFMTIPEAAQLVLQAGGMGDNGHVYVLDMGEPVRILDLAKDLIRLAGLEPYRDIDIVFTGMRPGEKLFEELLTAEEGTEASRHEKIWVAKNHLVPGDFPALLEELYHAARGGDGLEVRRALQRLVPTYRPEGVGVGGQGE